MKITGVQELRSVKEENYDDITSIECNIIYMDFDNDMESREKTKFF